MTPPTETQAERLSTEKRTLAQMSDGLKAGNLFPDLTTEIDAALTLLTRQQEEIERLTLGHASLFSYLVGLKMKEDPTMTLGDAEAIILAALQAKP